jgi:hypothetical protein
MKAASADAFHSTIRMTSTHIQKPKTAYKETSNVAYTERQSICTQVLAR